MAVKFHEGGIIPPAPGAAPDSIPAVLSPGAHTTLGPGESPAAATARLLEVGQRVAQLAETGALYVFEAQSREIPDDGTGYRTREPTGKSHFTCSCGHGTDWAPTDETLEQGRVHLHTKHPTWPKWDGSV